MKLDADIPTKLLIAQAKSGPTPRSRYDAIEALSAKDRDNVRELSLSADKGRRRLG